MRPRLFSDEQLFHAARECILEHGADVPTSVIAARLGVSHAALFKRIGSKEQLLARALCVSKSPEWFALLESGPDDRDPRTQLLEVARRVDAFLAEMGPMFAILRASGAHRPERLVCGDDAPPLRAHRLLTGWAARLAERHGAQVRDPGAFALMLMSAITARHTMRSALGVAYPDGGEKYVEYVVDALWQGIAPRAEPTRQPQRRRTAAHPARVRRESKTTGGRSKGQRT